MSIRSETLSLARPVKTVARPARRAPAARMGAGGNAIDRTVEECLAAIGDQVSVLEAISLNYRSRVLDWNDVGSLQELRDHLGAVVRGFGSAGVADAVRRAAGEVAIELRPRRD
jgi:hypothetical protein